MADIRVEQQAGAEQTPADDYSMLEVVLWIIGILMIPLVPIVMVALMTPFSGM